MQLERLDSVLNRGTGYQTVLGHLHEVLKPRSYLEVGVHTGATLAKSKARSIAVDVSFGVLEPGVVSGRSTTSFYQMPSDQFFEQHNPTKILGRTIDLSFLDGMHLFEFLFRDFINTEKHCSPDSIIVMHDCMPPDIYLARRDMDDRTLRSASGYPEGWCGDVWKVIPVLRKYRPELQVHCFDSDPTGLVCVTNLNPSSDVLQTNYEAILGEWVEKSVEDFGGIHNLSHVINPKPTSLIMDPTSLTTVFSPFMID